MYEQVSHSLLNEILIKLNPEIKHQELRHFYTRLGANFYSIYSLFHLLYGDRDDFKKQAQRLVETMARQYILRADELKKKDFDVATKVTEATTFYNGEDDHQDYYRKNGKSPYCHIYKKIF